MSNIAKHYSHQASLLIAAITGVLQIIMASIGLRFAEMFAGFGAELPLLTKVFLPGSPIYYGLPLIAVIAYLMRYFDVAPTRNIFIFLKAANALYVPIFIVAMYLPIFQLGAVAN